MKKSSSPKLDYQSLFSQTKVEKIRIEDEMKKSFIAYAMAVNVSRAIPDVRDGLKPVHRRILYAMGNELGLYNDKPYRKCAKIVGEVLGKFHPHGDSSVYDALVRMAQSFSIRYPVVDGQGNFGSVDGDPAAAYRYTEARLAKIAGEMLRDCDRNTVDFYPNFDESAMQPRVLPARFPALLVNGSDGIAVGMATNIPPHNLIEVISGVVAQIDNPEIELDELMTHITAPDYPTGGIIMGKAAIRQAYRTGRGGVVIRAKAEIEETEKGDRHRIIIRELPYQVNKAKLIEQIDALGKDKKVDGIFAINDESDREGMRVVIDIKRDANAQVVLNLLYKHSNLQISNGITLLALVDGEPRILSLKDIIAEYIKHQRDVIYRRTAFELTKAEERAHIVEGLVIGLLNIDEVIALIKASRDKQEAMGNLMERFALSDKQATAILDMRMQRLTSLEVAGLKLELAELKATIVKLSEILGSTVLIDGIIKSELIEISAKYGDGRKTDINADYGEILDADMIAEEEIVVSITHGGYIKRIASAEYKAQRRGGRGVTAHKPKEEDFVETIFATSTHRDLLFFTNFGKVYCIKGYEIPEASRTARGRAMINILPIAAEEKVNAVIPVENYAEGYLVMATKRGLIKKTEISEFSSIRKNGKIAATLEEGDEVISVQKTTGSSEILMASSTGKCIRFAEEDVRNTGRGSKGVKSIDLSKDDKVVDMIALKEGLAVITITENGYGKRCDLDEYRLQGRAGKGVKAGVFNEKTGLLVDLKLCAEDDDIMIIGADGTMIRVPANTISKIGRDTMGVKIMKVDSLSKVSSVAVVPHIEDEAETAEASSEIVDGVTAENGGVNSQE